ncbi:hypothetical protein LINPERHAP2_LOCUS9158 [Linum perenne]
MRTLKEELGIEDSREWSVISS